MKTKLMMLTLAGMLPALAQTATAGHTQWVVGGAVSVGPVAAAVGVGCGPSVAVSCRAVPPLIPPGAVALAPAPVYYAPAPPPVYVAPPPVYLPRPVIYPPPFCVAPPVIGFRIESGHWHRHRHHHHGTHCW